MQAPPISDPRYVSSSPKKNTALIVLLVLAVGGGCLCCPILAAIVFPVFAQARQAALRTACMNNLKQIGIGTEMYAVDNNGRTESAAHWCDQLQPYVKSQQAFSCPATKGNFGYEFSDKCSGVLLDKVKNPETTIEVFDSQKLERNAHGSQFDFPLPPRHRFPNAIYLDRHVGAARRTQ